MRRLNGFCKVRPYRASDSVRCLRGGHHEDREASRTRRVFDPANPVLKEVLANAENKEQHKVFVVLDESLARARPELARNIEAYFSAFSEPLKLVCAPFVIEGGERTKNSYFHVSEIHSHIDRYHIDRHSYVVAVGGGAILDMVGLAAATAHRGCRHLRIPTTTLSQAAGM